MVFDPRVLHTGSMIRGPKFAAFLAYGIENEHARTHFNYYHHQRKDLGYETLESELAGVLELYDLLPDLLKRSKVRNMAA